jgi:hypothetical protein
VKAAGLLLLSFSVSSLKPLSILQSLRRRLCLHRRRTANSLPPLLLPPLFAAPLLQFVRECRLVQIQDRVYLHHRHLTALLESGE